MTGDITKMISIRRAYKGHCTQDFKKAEKLIAAKDSDPAELEALVDRLTRTKFTFVSSLVPQYEPYTSS